MGRGGSMTKVLKNAESYIQKVEFVCRGCGLTFFMNKNSSFVKGKLEACPMCDSTNIEFKDLKLEKKV
jgi:rubrerythrin